MESFTLLWVPHARKNISTIEGVQRHESKCVTNNYSSFASVSDMLTPVFLILATIQYRRICAHAKLHMEILIHLSPNIAVSR